MGVISNGVGLLIILGVSIPLGLSKSALLAVGIQYLVFGVHGWPQNSEKFYDASGSATHLALVLFALLGAASSGHALHPRQIVLSVFSVMWLTRLGSYLFARILRDGRDERFEELKKSPLRFLGAWTLQALWVFLLELPVLILNNKEMSAGLTVLDYLGWSLWAAGFLLECIADAQKNAFRSKEANKGKFITSGLWAYSRHPNYCGEMMLWLGVCISGSSAFQGAEYMGWFSLGITVLLLTKVSGVPMLEKAGQEKWGDQPEYQHYMKHTSCIMLSSPAPAMEKQK